MMKKILSTCVVVFSLGLGIGVGVHFGAIGSATLGNTPIRVDHSPLVADDLSAAFREVSRDVSNSVVGIQATVKRQVARTGQDLFRQGGPNQNLPPEFHRFFNDDAFGGLFESPGGLNPEWYAPREYTQRGTGTGVIVAESGIVVTNNHVVRGAEEIQVTLKDGRVFTAELVGADEKTDIALLRIEADDLQAATLADSDLTEVGQWVLAIGSPFQLEQTVTAGIVSAKSRGDVGITDYEDFIQTDAAINPGNSGGPLVDLKGRVIGINTAIASKTGASMGVGFAIPSNMVRSVVESILENGEVSRGQLGAMISNLTPELATTFNYHSTQGVLINDVLPKSAAAKAGLKPGDIVTHYNGHEMTKQHQLRSSVARSKPGSENTLTVFRDGEIVQVKVRLGKLDEDSVAGAVPKAGASVDGGDIDNPLGIAIAPLSDETIQRFDLADRFERGVVIIDVQGNSPAARLGLRAGDIIVAIGDMKIVSPRDFDNVVKDVDLAQGIRLQVVRDGFNQFLFLRSR